MGEPATKVEEEGVDTLEENNTVVEELETDEVELDEDGNEIVKVVELEEWEKTGEEPIVGEDGKLPDVPVETHIKQKEKWKRKKTAVDDENVKLKAEIEALKARSNGPQSTEPKRPDRDDFEDDDDYQEAKEQYFMDKIELKKNAGRVAERNQAITDRIKTGVDQHNVRVGDFVEEKKINPDVYSNAESNFINAIDEVYPGSGEANADNLLSKLGKGSEKILYFFGRNKTKLNELKELLKEDPSGIKAGMFLGSENVRLGGISAGKQKSKAPKPAATATGDVNAKSDSASGKALKKKYDAAHKAGDGTLAYSIRTTARKEHKIDTSKW